MEDVPNDEVKARAIRVWVFFTFTLTVSLPALGWALASVFTPRKNRRASGFTFPLLLLLSDVSELTMTLSVVRALMGGGVYCGLSSLVSLKSPLILLGCRLSGLYLHQLVAIESTWNLMNPRSSAQFFSLHCSVGMSILCILIVFLFIMFMDNLPNLIFVLLSMFFTCGCVLLYLYDISKTKQTVRQLGQPMIAVCLFTVAVLHGPLVVYMVQHQRPEEALMDRYADMAASQWGSMSLSISSLRVLADALLCVLSCRASA